METAVRFGILGSLHVQRGKRQITVSAAKQRIILAKLLLEANRVVLTDELMDLLWPDRYPRHGRASLQTHLSRLRRTLGDDRDGQGTIRTRPGGYLIEVTAEHLDLLRHRELVGQAARARAVGDLERELHLLREALALWRGPALADVPSDALQREDVPQLTEEWFGVLHRRFDVELRLGNHHEIVGELRRLVLRYPLRESLCGQLMIALFRCGQQAEALHVYMSVSSVLRGEYGLDAGEELKRLHRAVLVGDPELRAGSGGRGGAGGAGGARLD